MKTAFGLPIETRLTQVRLITRSIAAMSVFYGKALGLTRQELSSGQAAFIAPGGQSQPLVVLSEDPGALSRPRRGTGLYHIAIRFPTRLDLAQALRRVLNERYAIDGASDHLFSEAVYLSDPDGNGVELYADRPRNQWPMKNGVLSAASNPLDIHSLLESAGTAGIPPAAPAGTDLGHIHLHVGSLPEAERFYGDFFGLDVTIREMPGALFFAAGGYHHHVGVNTWAGPASPPERSLGLQAYRFTVPMREVLYCLSQRAPFAGYETRMQTAETGEEVLRIRDPIGCWLEVAMA